MVSVEAKTLTACMLLLLVSLAGCTEGGPVDEPAAEAPETVAVEVEDLRVDPAADSLAVFFRLVGPSDVVATVTLRVGGEEVGSHRFSGPGHHAHRFEGLATGATIDVHATASAGDASDTATLDVSLTGDAAGPDVLVQDDAAAAAGAGAVRITWRIEGPAGTSSHVRYGEGLQLDNLSAGQDGPGGHETIIDGVPFGTEHGFQVVARYDGRDVATGKIHFLTLSPEPAVIADVQVLDVSQTEATVHWNLSDGPDGVTSHVAYGDGEASASQSGNGEHSVRLEGLPSGSAVAYRIVAEDASGEIASSPTRTFRTASEDAGSGGSGGSGGTGGSGDGDTDAPVISQVNVVDTTQDSATIRWDVADDSSVTSWVAYGSGFGQTSGVQTGTGTQQVTLAGLDEDTTYDFRIEAEDAGGLAESSSASSFTTDPPAAVALQISAVSSDSVLHDAFMVHYTVDGPAGLGTHVEYGPTSGYGSTTNGPSGPGTHSVHLSGLSGETDYHFRVVAEAGSDREESSDREERTAKLVDVEIISMSAPYFADDPLVVPGGVPLQFRVKNSDSATHTWEVIGQNHVTPGISSGQTHTFASSITLASGSYEQRCTIHPSMLGDIDVT